MEIAFIILTTWEISKEQGLAFQTIDLAAKNDNLKSRCF
jgi:hypothetical protein